MATISGTPRPAYVYDAANSQWVPIGFGPHTHAVTDVTNAFNTTTVTAKGDLVVAAGSNSVTKLPVGANGQTLVPDSSTTTGLRWQDSTQAGKNFLINGGFDIWQRGTTINAATHSTYTADQWVMVNDSVGTVNVTRQTIADQGLGVIYAMRVEKSAGANNRVVMVAVPEGALNCIGKTVTFSGYFRKGSGLTSNVTVDIGTRATRYGTQYDGATSIAVNNAALSTTSFTRFSTTFTITSATSTNNANLFEVEIRFDQAGGSNVYLEFAAMQVEVGSVATPFSRAGGSIGGELALCQRYYYRQTAVSAYGWMAYGGCQNTVNGQAGLVLPVQMRAVPTALEYANLRVVDSSYAGTLTSLALNTGESTPNVADIYVTASGITGGRPLYIGANNNAGAYIAVTAEL